MDDLPLIPPWHQKAFRRRLRAYLGLGLALVSGCAHNPAQSWDQANLKRHDSGCPTAVFVAPDGVLTQC
jgi:hypothetical protein